MKFSIVTSFFNNNDGDYTKQVYQSIINQTYTDWEWIITDDFSTDGTLEKIKNFSDSRVKFITQKEKKELFFNPHKYASGDIVVQLDSDDQIYPKALEVYNHFFYKNPDVFFMSVGTNYYESDNFLDSQVIYHGQFSNCFEKKIEKDNNWKNKFNFLHINGAWGNLQAWRNIKEINFNPKRYENIIHPDLIRALTLEEYGKYLHLPRTLYKNNIRKNGLSHREMTNDEIIDYSLYLNDVKKRRKGNLESYDKRYNDVFEETYMMMYSDFIFEKERKNISIFNVDFEKEKKLKELYFDHDLYFNQISDKIDYYFFFIKNESNIDFIKNNNLNGVLYVPFDRKINLTNYFNNFKFYNEFYGSQILSL